MKPPRPARGSRDATGSLCCKAPFGQFDLVVLQVAQGRDRGFAAFHVQLRPLHFQAADLPARACEFRLQAADIAQNTCFFLAHGQHVRELDQPSRQSRPAQNRVQDDRRGAKNPGSFPNRAFRLRASRGRARTAHSATKGATPGRPGALETALRTAPGPGPGHSPATPSAHRAPRPAETEPPETRRTATPIHGHTPAA